MPSAVMGPRAKMDYMKLLEDEWKLLYPLLTSTDPIDKPAVVAKAKSIGITDIRFYDAPIMNKFPYYAGRNDAVLSSAVMLDIGNVLGAVVQPGIFYSAKMPGYQHAEAWRKITGSIPYINPSDLHVAAYLSAAKKAGLRDDYDASQGGYGFKSKNIKVIENILPMVGLFSLNSKNQLRVIQRPRQIYGHFDKMLTSGSPYDDSDCTKPVMQFRNGKYVYMVHGQAIISDRENVYDAALMDTPDVIKHKIVKKFTKEFLLEHASETGQEYIVVETLKGKDPLMANYNPYARAGGNGAYGGILRAQVMLRW